VRDADVIVTPLATLLPLVAGLRARPKVVLVSYGIVALWERAGTARRRLVRASVRSADRVVSIASSTTDRLARIGGIDASGIDFVPFGVDEGFWRPTPPALGGHVLAVGRDLARDYRTFAAALEGTGLRGIVVAKEENLRGVDIPANIDVKMFISTDELRQLYADAACVVLPLVPDDDPRGTESSGNTAVLEAMACGHAPVVTDRAPLRDYVSPETATVVRPRDERALRDAIRAKVDDHATSVAMGATARARIEERFTTRAFARRLADVLREVA
jgi:glycosyltransferase involved in cell wall biosynthesis